MNLIEEALTIEEVKSFSEMCNKVTKLHSDKQ